jgi:glycerol-3-phosphate acyltransferase PlsY
VAAAILGHAFPAFAGLRGGKGVMTFVGGALALAPVAGVLALAAGVLAGLFARSLAVGARVVVFAIPVAQLVTDGAHRVAATGALMCLVGALFAGGGRSARARSGPGAAPTR